MDRIALLRTIPMFQELEADDLAALARSLEAKEYLAGTLVFNQGEAGDAMYIVADGHINIHLPGEASRRVSLKDISRGEYFGELALFDDKPRSASALATTKATLLALSRETLASYLQRRPLTAMAILRTLSERLRETNAMLSARAAKNAVEEIERNLSWQDKLADKIAELNGSWAFIVLLLVLSLGWAVVNSPKVHAEPFDPYPFQFYNLFLAILVGLQGPLIVMSQNRQAVKDRATAETDFKVNLKNEVNIESILRELAEFRAEASARLDSLERGTSHVPIPAPSKRADEDISSGG